MIKVISQGHLKGDDSALIQKLTYRFCIQVFILTKLEKSS